VYIYGEREKRQTTSDQGFITCQVEKYSFTSAVKYQDQTF